MAYGIEVYNSEGLKVMDFERTLYVKDTGSLVNGNTGYYVPSLAVSGAKRMFGPLDYALNFACQTAFAAFASARFPIVTMLPWSGYETATSGGGSTSVLPTMNMEVGDLIFNRIDSHGVYTQWNGFVNRPEFGAKRGTSFINTEGNNTVPFIHASPTPPAGTPSEQYGVQLFDASGVNMFDSRRPIFSVRYAVLISGAALSSLISTGVAIDIPLPVPIPGAYVSAPYMSAYFSVTPTTGSRWRLYSAMLKQVAPDMLRITREAILDNASPAGATRNFSQDAFILVGRPL